MNEMQKNRWKDMAENSAKNSSYYFTDFLSQQEVSDVLSAFSENEVRKILCLWQRGLGEAHRPKGENAMHFFPWVYACYKKNDNFSPTRDRARKKSPYYIDVYFWSKNSKKKCSKFLCHCTLFLIDAFKSTEKGYLTRIKSDP